MDRVAHRSLVSVLGVFQPEEAVLNHSSCGAQPTGFIAGWFVLPWGRSWIIARVGFLACVFPRSQFF